MATKRKAPSTTVEEDDDASTDEPTAKRGRS